MFYLKSWLGSMMHSTPFYPIASIWFYWLIMIPRCFRMLAGKVYTKWFISDQDNILAYTLASGGSMVILIFTHYLTTGALRGTFGLTIPHIPITTVIPIALIILTLESLIYSYNHHVYVHEYASLSVFGRMLEVQERYHRLTRMLTNDQITRESLMIIAGDTDRVYALPKPPSVLHNELLSMVPKIIQLLEDYALDQEKENNIYRIDIDKMITDLKVIHEDLTAPDQEAEM